MLCFIISCIRCVPIQNVKVHIEIDHDERSYLFKFYFENSMGIFDIDLFGKKSKRKPLSSSRKTDALLKSKGKCAKCGIQLTAATKEIHHKDGNRRNDRPSNLMVLCRNCHGEISHRQKKRKGRKPKNILDIDVRDW